MFVRSGIHANGLTMKITEALLRGLIILLGHLPVVVARALGAGVGYLMGLGQGRSRRVAATNLALCLPELSEEARAQLVKDRLVRLGSTAMDIAIIWGRSIRSAKALVRQVHGRETIDAAIAKGQGVIILAPHIGNWEILGVYLSELSLQTHFMYAPPKQAVVGAAMFAGRQKNGAVLVPADRSGVVGLLKALRKGDMVGVLPDQVPGADNGIYADFFGQPALTMTLLSNLARRTGAEVVCAYSLPCKGGFDVFFEPVGDQINKADIETSVQFMNSVIEDLVRRHPSHYQWEYKRFKNPPPGQPSRY